MKPAGRAAAPEFHISPERNSVAALQLFSALLNEAINAEKRIGKKFEVRPGTLLVWAHTTRPTVQELSQLAALPHAPAGWPKLAAKAWPELRGGVFAAVLHRALEIAPRYRLSPQEVCTILAAVAQTVLTDSPAIRERNFRLAEVFREPQALPSQTVIAAQPEQAALAQPVEPRPLSLTRQPYNPRVDEIGGLIEGNGLRAAFASCVGPKYADSTTNEDACYALLQRKYLIFALADGVGTSVGARFAAAASCFTFCQKLGSILDTIGNAGAQALSEAVQATQSFLDEAVESFISNWKCHDFSELYGDMPRDTTEQLLENTRNPNRRWAPAMATTLVGGFLFSDNDAFRGYLLRIGDGIAELVSGSHVERLLDMDSTETRVSAFLAPGPLSKARVREYATILPIAMSRSEHLLISSDGLTRGHKSSVWAQLQEAVPLKILPPAEHTSSYAADVLRSAAEHADRRHELDPNSSLFRDNLSLIHIFPTGQAGGVQ